jgi:hypothetical protein
MAGERGLPSPPPFFVPFPKELRPVIKPTALIFFDWLFSSILKKRPDFSIATWSHPSRSTQFHKTTESAAKAAEEISGKENVYFAVCPLSSIPAKGAKGGQGRGTIENYGALTCLWADIDIVDMVHKKQNLPSSIEEAVGLLVDDLKVEPSIITHSGHGIQAYWLLKEPWVFKDEEDRAAAQGFTELWHLTIKYFAEKRGWTVDSVFDLPRILRVPGTMNIKDPKNPKAVEFIEPVFVPSSGEINRYSLENLELFTLAPELLVQVKGNNRPKVTVEPVLPSTSKFSANDYPDFLKSMAENDPQFKRTLDRTRRDMSDQSPSSYDFSLANQMAGAGCSDQEIADAIAWWRSRHCQDEKDRQKAYRRDYIQRTLTKIRTDLGAAQALDLVCQSPLELLETEDKGKRDKAKAELLANISQGLGVVISRVIKHGLENARYSFELENGLQVSIGGLAALLNQDAVRVCLGDATGILISMVKKPEWHKLIQRILLVCDYVTNEESDVKRLITQWLASYLSNDHIAVNEDGSNPEETNEAHLRSQPYIENGLYHISSNAFLKYIEINFDKGIKKGDLWEALRLEGWVNGQKNKLIDGKQVNRLMWTRPADQASDEDTPY